MGVPARRLRAIAAAVLAASLITGAAACSADDGGSNEPGKTTITLQWFGSPGFDQAVKDFEALNPNIKVNSENRGQLRDFQPLLVQWLATGSPQLGDVVMLEEGTLLEFLQDPSKWTNLLDLGAASLKDNYLPYKWENGFTADKSKLVGLGTDVGGLAMCYRRDLLAKAGMPTDREAVSKLWPTWSAYAEQGAKFKAAKTGAAWIDSATSIMQPYIMQNSDTWFYDRSNNFILGTNPVVKQAWDYGLGLAQNGLTAKLIRWTPDWDAAFANAAFATVPCAAWGTGVISERAGAAASGKWDIATIPGGSGNWGGSYLAIPAQSTKKDAAYKLLTYLTGKAGHLAEFKEKGTMPSTIAALDDPAFAGATNAYFNNAPVGVIFGGSVKALKPIYLGPKHQQLWETILEPNMQAVEQGHLSSADAFAKSIADGRDLATG
jgi:cellobiose transport system substrate-binding protein